MQILQENEWINGTYQIVQEIGAGGMGVIYLAYHHNLRKYVVIKKIKEDFVGRLDVRAEVDIMKNLRHSYIPQIYDFIQLGTDIYTVMDYIDGRDLKYYITNNTWFSEEELVKWLTEALEVLEYLHSQTPPIIHSDIKPANIMLDTEGDICLIDFNISLEQNNFQHVIAATAAYAPKEQTDTQWVYDPLTGNYVETTVVDARTDIYSLGATFYHLATHIKPNQQINYTNPIVQLDIPYSEAFAKIIYKAMQENPEDRYQSATEMLRAVRDIRKNTTAYKAIRAGIIAGSCVLGLLIGCGGIFLYRQSRQKQAEAFQKEYVRTLQISADYNPQSAIEEDMELLNNEKYDTYFEDDPEKKGNLLYQMATAYYAMEQYDTANEYFLEALTYIQTSDCYRDYAISVAKSGDLQGALHVIDSHPSELKELDAKQIQAEVYLLQGQYRQAIDNLNYVKQQTIDIDDSVRVTVMLSEAYYNMQDYESMRKTVEDANLPENYGVTKNHLLATAYIGLASQDEVEAHRQQDYKQAQTCLEELEQQGTMSYEDALNLVIVYSNLGQWHTARVKLSAMLDEYPDDYHLYTQMCFLIYGEQAEKKTAERKYEEFESYYEQTIRLYNEQNTSGAEDDKILQLKQMQEELKSKGYIK